jgi:hypothetical protein
MKPKPKFRIQNSEIEYPQFHWKTMKKVIFFKVMFGITHSHFLSISQCNVMKETNADFDNKNEYEELMNEPESMA